MTEEIDRAARAIWAVRPDCRGKEWPLETAEQRRAYPHNPIAAVDLCFLYAKAALETQSGLVAAFPKGAALCASASSGVPEQRKSNILSRDEEMTIQCGGSGAPLISPTSHSVETERTTARRLTALPATPLGSTLAGLNEVEEQVRGIKRASNKPTPEGEGK